MNLLFINNNNNRFTMDRATIIGNFVVASGPIAAIGSIIYVRTCKQSLTDVSLKYTGCVVGACVLSSFGIIAIKSNSSKKIHENVLPIMIGCFGRHITAYWSTLIKIYNLNKFFVSMSNNFSDFSIIH